MGHLVEALFSDTDLAEVHRNADALKEFVCGVNGFLGDFLFGQGRVNPEYVDAVFDEAGQSVPVQDMLHPAGRDDGEAFAVGDVIIGAQGVLDAVAGPAALAVAKRQDAVAAVGAAEHHLRPCRVIFRILKALARIHHQALQHRFAETVIQQRGILGEVLLDGVVHSVGATGGSLLLGDGECISGVEEGCNREQQRVHITDFVVGLGARDDASAVIFTACCSEGDYVHDGQRCLSLHFVGYEVPGVSVILGSCSDCLRE